jgi:hypothetical protein
MHLSCTFLGLLFLLLKLMSGMQSNIDESIKVQSWDNGMPGPLNSNQGFFQRYASNAPEPYYTRQGP